MGAESAAMMIAAGPYMGSSVRGSVLQDGPYAGEVLAECQRPLGSAQIDGRNYTAPEMRRFREWFGDVGETGTSRLFLDNSRAMGSICLQVGDPGHNKYMLKRLNAECRKLPDDSLCDPVKEVLRSMEPKEHYGLMIGGALLTAVAFVVVGFCFPLVSLAVRIGICLISAGSPFLLHELLDS